MTWKQSNLCCHSKSKPNSDTFFNIFMLLYNSDLTTEFY